MFACGAIPLIKVDAAAIPETCVPWPLLSEALKSSLVPSGQQLDDAPSDIEQ